MNKVKEYANEVAIKVGGFVVEVESFHGKWTSYGIVVAPEGSNVYPCFYAAPKLNMGMSADEFAEEIVNATADMDEFKTSYREVVLIPSFRYAVREISVRLYNKKYANDASVTAKAFGFDDLVLVPFVNTLYSNGELAGFCKVNLSLLEKWEQTSTDIVFIGLATSDVKVQSLVEAPATMLVVTNKSMNFGAASVIMYRTMLEHIFPEGYTVIPSSVHECIVLSKLYADDFSGMIDDVNTKFVGNRYILSDHAYVIGGNK